MRTQAHSKILVPIGLSPASEAVLGPTLAIARARCSDLILVHSVAPAASLVPFGEDSVTWADARAGEEQWSAQARDMLAALAGRLNDVGVVATTEVIAAPDVAAAIVKRAQRDGTITMIAMALRNAPTFRYQAITSVAQAVVRQAGVPVLLMRSAAGPTSLPERPVPAQPSLAAAPIETISVPLDGSARAERALSTALPIVRATHATLLLVAALPPVVSCEQEADPLESRAGAAARGTSLAAYVEQCAAELRTTGLAVQTLLQTGDPADVILDAATTCHVDLIVMTTHGRTGPHQFTPGSVASAVARRARLPLLFLGPQAWAPDAQRQALPDRTALPRQRA